MIVNPVFTNSKERNDIVSRDDVSYMQEIPNSEKNYVIQGSTSLTEAGANFQATNLNTYAVGQFRARAKRRYIFSGYTVLPISTAKQDNWKGTSAALWNPYQSTVDSFCINKCIQELKFNIAGKQFTSVDRENPEMIDLYSTQFNIDALKSWGILGKDGVKDAEQCLHNLNNAHGSTLFSANQFSSNASLSICSAHLQNNYPTNHLAQSTPWIRNSNGYCRFTISYKKGATYSTATDLQTVYSQQGNDMGFPLPSENGIDVYYSVAPVAADAANPIANPATSTQLWQIVDLEILEDLIDPNLSNSYSKNQNKKIYYNGSNSLNIEFKFNKEYLDNSFLQWTVPVQNAANFATPADVPTKLVSASWVDMDIRFWTFNSASPIPQNPMKIFYYKELRQTPHQFSIARGATQDASKAQGLINTALQSSMPPFIIIYGACRKSQNSTYFAQPQESSNVEMFDIESVNLQVATQSDTLGNIELNRDELVQHTLDVISNPEYRQMLRSELTLLSHGDFGQTTIGLNYGDLSVAGSAGNLMSSIQINLVETKKLAQKMLTSVGWNFYIIDMARINVRSTSGVPVVPLVNFGAQQSKAISVRPTFKYTKQMFDANVTPLVCEFNLVLMRPFIRTLPIGNGSLTDDEVVFTQGDVAGSIMEKINSDYGNSGVNQISYMGGAFLGNLGNKAMEVLRNPVVKGLITSAVSAMGDSGSGASLEQRMRNKYGRA